MIIALEGYGPPWLGSDLQPKSNFNVLYTSEFKIVKYYFSTNVITIVILIHKFNVQNMKLKLKT